jgi:hypothetical protein
MRMIPSNTFVVLASMISGKREGATSLAKGVGKVRDGPGWMHWGASAWALGGENLFALRPANFGAETIDAETTSWRPVDGKIR